ncbi:MAG: class I SAM-dependent methyltransferase, partial [Acidimicrobiia bacterium]|nr:class I SAM-dependent methyltransferase [Acidimicrobiia bacterium]
MIDEETARIYQQEGLRWTESRSAMHSRAVEWINAERRSGPILDLGTGPGWHLALCRAPAVGVDIASAMLELARTRTDHPLVNASAGRLPFGRQTVGGAIASRVYNHLHLTDNPMALADLHRCLQPGAPVLFHFLGFPDGIRLETGEEGADSPGETDNQGGTDSLHVGFDTRSGPPFAGRLSSLWTETGLADLMEGAGF